MTYNNYLTDCLTFAKETAKWAALDHYSVYTTNGSGWKELCTIPFALLKSQHVLPTQLSLPVRC